MAFNKKEYDKKWYKDNIESRKESRRFNNINNTIMKVYITFFKDICNTVKIFQVSETQDIADEARTRAIKDFDNGWTISINVVMDKEVSIINEL